MRKSGYLLSNFVFDFCSRMQACSRYSSDSLASSIVPVGFSGVASLGELQTRWLPYGCGRPLRRNHRLF